MPITITVPEETTSGFVVAADRKFDDLSAVIRHGLPDSLADAVSRRVGSPRLTITSYRATDSPWDLGDVVGLDEEDAARAVKATCHIGVTSALPVGDLPSGPHTARAIAMAIAESVSGVPVDLASNEPLPIVPFERLDEFLLADNWLGVALPPHRNSGDCTAEEEDIDGCACVDLTTRGLHRFGLPELEITDVACPHSLAALNVLRTTAQRLLPLGRHPGEHTVPNELMLTSTDFATYWGYSDPMWDDGPLPIDLVEVNPTRLAIRPPIDFPGTLNEWLWDELPPILHELLSCEPDRPEPN
ncbi:hypothetical protein BZB76_2755 [Actinomadura pelletieri DSM 43383]|uniref:Uncharacterized protein n=1 Tax=Actinomadura pelletieri DSM 43383 TaxID=1120940 RepID=A0A495QMT9_9ACTN|nr:hypothetical protein [Actinomadura pelletieri]RKS74246.1 hypothetical protein BZB76_2755 [Actinomadura pelletieri DSM 43383]